jgi:Rieske Fe-S protein
MARGRHASSDRTPFFRDLAIMGLVIVVVAMLVFGAISLIDGLRDGSSPTAEVTTTTTTATTSVGPSTTATTRPETTTTTAAPTTTTTAATPTTVRPPSEVRVLVLNAVGTPGLAGTVTDQLAALGYDMVTPDNADEQLDQSRIWYRRGFGAEALELGAQIPDALIELIPDPELDADIVVVLGRSYEG